METNKPRGEEINETHKNRTREMEDWTGKPYVLTGEQWEKISGKKMPYASTEVGRDNRVVFLYPNGKARTWAQISSESMIILNEGTTDTNKLGFPEAGTPEAELWERAGKMQITPDSIEGMKKAENFFRDLKERPESLVNEVIMLHAEIHAENRKPGKGILSELQKLNYLVEQLYRKIEEGKK